MLRSTHKSATTSLDQTPLPLSWSEHIAPSGHKYYYNAETKQSTYVRPSTPAAEQHQSQLSVLSPSIPLHYTRTSGYEAYSIYGVQSASNLPSNINRPQRRQPEDRPKSKHVIPGCSPWLLIKTRFGRRFVHNPITKESFWKFPKDIVGGVVEFDIQERDKVSQGSPPDNVDVQGERPPLVSGATTVSAGYAGVNSTSEGNEKITEAEPLDDEYEEIEVTDNESEDDGNSAKRLKVESDASSNQPLEFGEEDMARQLAEMGHMYQLDPGEYGDRGFNEEGEVEVGTGEGRNEDTGLTEDEAAASFMDLLDDFNINPYTTWEKVISDGYIIDDDRYTLLPNMKRRNQVFTEWSAVRIQQHKDEREKQLRQDPRVPYLTLLEKCATPKLFWPEFKRKYKKEPELRDSKLGDKERETLYRSHINRITKIPEEALKADLELLMQSVPPSRSWNRSTSLRDGLPPALLGDVRFISLKPNVRDAVVLSYLAGLPDANEVNMNRPSTEATARERGQRRQELALSRRDKEVDKAKERQRKELDFGRRRLQEEEQELSRAMRVGKEGLVMHMEGGAVIEE